MYKIKIFNYGACLEPQVKKVNQFTASTRKWEKSIQFSNEINGCKVYVRIFPNQRPKIHFEVADDATIVTEAHGYLVDFVQTFGKFLNATVVFDYYDLNKLIQDSSLTFPWKS